MKRLIPLLLLCTFLRAEDDERELPRIQFTTALADVQVVAKGGNADAALAEYQKPGPMTPEKMAAIYKAAGKGEYAFKTVAYLIANGKISDADSVAMAQIRENMIEGLIKDIAKEKNLRVGRSDSGNVTSGMRSDLDQTFYVFEMVEEDGKLVPKRGDAKLDAAFIAEFNERWNKMYAERGLSLQAVDVASISGSNRFPDVRVTKINAFFGDNLRTSEALRATPGAYTYGGAVGHQMQFRALEAILKGNPRAFQVYEPGENDEYRRVAGDAAEAIRTMFGKAPELRPVWAFDAALANFLELQHYMHAKKFESKYHLRTWEDSAFSKFLADRGLGRTSKVELIDMGLNKRRQFNKVILERIFPGAENAKQRRLHTMALEISVALRLHHKDELGKISAFRGSPPAGEEAQKRAIFEDLGREMWGDRWGDPQSAAFQMEGVKRRYRLLASEFCLETAYHASKESFAALLDEGGSRHLDVERYRGLMNIESDAEWDRTKRNLRDAAQLTFLYGIYELGLTKSVTLMNRIRADFGNQHVPRLLAMWMRGRLYGIEAPLRDKGLRGLYEEFRTKKLPEIGKRVQSHVLSELGYERIAVANKVNGELTKHKLVWNGGKFFTNMALDPGNIDAIAQVIRTIYETKGDEEAIRRAIAMEFLMAIPVAGQVVGAMRGGVASLVPMGIAMAYPPAGAVLVAISVGQAGYAIYDVEVRTPARANAVNAIYRGFIGPELRSFDKDPPQFTVAHDDPAKRDGSSDEERLQALEARIAAASEETKAELRRIHYDLRKDIEIKEARRLMRQMEDVVAKFSRVRRELEPELEELKQKRTVWEAFRDDPAFGGYFTGGGAQKIQRPFTNYLLAGIEPIISFSPAGIIDFRAEQDPTELQRLERAIKAAPDFESMLKAESAYYLASLRRERQLRAERYYERAVGKSRDDADMHETEKRMGVPELRYKLKRDSLYPGLRKLGYDNPDAFVDKWLAGNEKVLAELVSRNLVEPDSDFVMEPAFPLPQPRPTKLSRLPAAYVKQLKALVRADYQRSKVLYEKYEEREKVRKLKAQQDLERRIEAFEAAAAGQAVGRMLQDEKTKVLKDLYTAMREGLLVPQAPQVETTVYKLTESKPAKYALSFRLRADPYLFKPKYTSTLHAFDVKEAKSAARSGKAKGQPLFDSTVARLKRWADGKPEDGDDVVFVASVLCADVHESVKGVPRAGDRYVIGQSVHTGKDSKPEEPGEEIWSLFERRMHVNDHDKLYAELRRRFPELAHVGRRQRNQLHFSWLPIKLKPSPRVIRLKGVAARIRVNKQLGKPADYGLHLGFSGPRGPYYITVTCNAQTRHLYQIPGKSPLGNTKFVGIPNGVHRVSARAVLNDGRQIRGSFRIVMKRREAPSKVAQNIEWVAKKRAQLEEYPVARHPKNAGSLRNMLAGLVRHMIIEAHAEKEIIPLLQEMAELIPPERAPNSRGEPTLSPYAEVKAVKAIARHCRSLGSRDAYEILKKAHEGAKARVRDTKSDGDLAHIEHVLCELAVGGANDLGAGRKHMEAVYALRKATSPNYNPPPLDSWWPKQR